MQLEVRLGGNQVSLRHVVKHVEALGGVVRPHVHEQGALLGQLIDAVQMVVDLVGQQTSQHSWASHLRPNQVHQFGSWATPPLLLTQLLRTVPAASFDHRTHQCMVVAGRLHVKLVRFLGLLRLRGLARVCPQHDTVQHAEDLRFEDGHEVF